MRELSELLDILEPLCFPSASDDRQNPAEEAQALSGGLDLPASQLLGPELSVVVISWEADKV